MKSSTAFASRKLTLRHSKHSFHNKPAKDSQATLPTHNRLKIFSGPPKEFSLLKKLIDKRYPHANKSSLARQTSPKNFVPHHDNKENICPNKLQKLSPKSIDNDDSLQACDEEVYDKSDSLANHRFSDIYKPSKFIQDRKSNHENVRLENRSGQATTTSSHARHQSLINGESSAVHVVTMPDYGAMKYTYTEECGDEPVYMLTEGFDISAKDKEYDDFCTILGRTIWEEEKRWSFQQQYKLQKSYLEVSNTIHSDILTLAIDETRRFR